MKRLLLSMITFAVCAICSGKTVTLLLMELEKQKERF